MFPTTKSSSPPMSVGVPARLAQRTTSPIFFSKTVVIVLCMMSNLGSLHSGPVYVEGMRADVALRDRPISVWNDDCFGRELQKGPRQWLLVACAVDRTGDKPEHVGDCKKLVPAFERYARERGGQDGKIGYAEVDCAASPQLCGRLDATPGSVVHLVDGQSVGSWSKLRQREGTLLYPWMNQQVSDFDVPQGSFSKGAFEMADGTPWHPFVAAVNVMLVSLFTVHLAAARILVSAAKLGGAMLGFLGTVAVLRVASAPRLTPYHQAAEEGGTKNIGGEVAKTLAKLREAGCGQVVVLPPQSTVESLRRRPEASLAERPED